MSLGYICCCPSWQDRGDFIESIEYVSYYHYDHYSQAHSKIGRGHEKDVLDVETILSRGLIQKDRLLELFEMIRPDLYKYPAIDEQNFAASVQRIATTATNI